MQMKMAIRKTKQIINQSIKKPQSLEVVGANEACCVQKAAIYNCNLRVVVGRKPILS